MAEKRLKIKVYGVVQGVGFRPFVHNLAVSHGLCGSVCNKGPFVDIEVQGGEHRLAAFLRALKEQAPPRSQIEKTQTEELPLADLTEFVILQSENSSGEVFPSPDIAICNDCTKELFNPENRRYLHPFINCTACGPRLTITEKMPYDRARTSMSGFEMCENCRDEYTNTYDRRYHAQPVCCNECGPTLEIVGTISQGYDTCDPIAAVRAVLRGGGIAAVKGIGGFHLCCDAANEQAVSRLRALKHRPAKPFAVMARDMRIAERECVMDEAAKAVLDSPQKPIVLLQKQPGGLVCEQCAPQNPNLGVMLPYAPVQLLLFRYPDGKAFTDCLVMTSGNISGEPICIDGEQAVSRLSGLCDIILSNNREIRMRSDDSVLSMYRGAPYMLRRSRGYSPLPVTFVKEGKKPVFAVGGELKNAFCLAAGDKMYLSPHVGDLSDPLCVQALGDTYSRFKTLLRIEPQAVVCDLHPGYQSTAFAKTLGLPVLQVQHHFAHIAACMAENSLSGEVIGVSFDGTGYGTDGTIWGGEFLRVSYGGFERLGHIASFPLAGGDAAAREGYRPAVGQLIAACGAQRAKELALALGLCTQQQLAAQMGLIHNGLNCVSATSAGRLFDAASAILGIKQASTYEGEAASALEAAAKSYMGERDMTETGNVCALPQSDTNAIIKLLAEKRLDGGQPQELAYQFHAALAEMILRGCLDCREKTGLDRVALSGGVFANRLLLELCEARLTEQNFQVYKHALVPCNDGGLALGQAAAGTVLLRK